MRRLFPLLALPLLLTGCVGALVAAGTETGVSLAENRSLGRKMDDNVLYTDITNQFIQDDDARLIRDVTFNIRYARVMLTGIVKSDADAQKAVAITWKARGVQEVINELIVSQDSSILNTANDALIKHNLEARLLVTKDVWLINYSMDVQDGTAYFIGRVKDKGELNRVMNVARATKGVKRVVNHLQVNPDTQNAVAAPGETGAMPVETAPLTPSPAAATSPVKGGSGSIQSGPIPQDSTRPAWSNDSSVSSAPLATPAH